MSTYEQPTGDLPIVAGVENRVAIAALAKDVGLFVESGMYPLHEILRAYNLLDAQFESIRHTDDYIRDHGKWSRMLVSDPEGAIREQARLYFTGHMRQLGDAMASKHTTLEQKIKIMKMLGEIGDVKPKQEGGNSGISVNINFGEIMGKQMKVVEGEVLDG